MDSLITAAARALAAGDPLGALKRVGLRDDPPALALRGIAMAQLGDLSRARTLVRSAARGFSPREAVARARCIVAEAEIALAARDLSWPMNALDAARLTLETHGDAINAAHARHLEVRRLLLIGRLDEAERLLCGLDPARLPAALRAVHELAAAGIAMRRVQGKAARAALARATRAAREARIPALLAEIEIAARGLAAPVARLLRGGKVQSLVLEEVEALQSSSALIVDACRYVVRAGGTAVALGRRPVLFTLARALAEAWPGDVPRQALVSRAFRARQADESHRARLRVEMGRLRRALRIQPVLQLLHADARHAGLEGRHRVVAEEEARAAVAHHAGQLLRRGAGGQGRHGEAGAQAAQEQQHIGNGIGAADRDARARLHAVALQRGGHAVGGGVEFLPGHALVALPQGEVRGPGAGSCVPGM